MFCCTGSEANELAMRIARTHTGGTGFICNRVSPTTEIARATYEITTSDIPEGRASRVPSSSRCPCQIPYRGPYSQDRTVPARRPMPNHVSRSNPERWKAVESSLRGSSSTRLHLRAASYRLRAGYLSARVAEIVREARRPLHSGRSAAGLSPARAQHFWGYQADEFVPDIVTMGKPMGNGHPLAGVVTRSSIVAEFADKGRYFNTFGGNPVSCAAGLAVLDVIEREGLQANALELGQYLVDGLWRLAERHDCIGDVRGCGFFLGLELVEDRKTKAPAASLAKQVINDLRTRGLLTSTIGPHANVLKLRCPMVLERADADYALGLIDQSLEAVGR